MWYTNQLWQLRIILQTLVRNFISKEFPFTIHFPSLSVSLTPFLYECNSRTPSSMRMMLGVSISLNSQARKLSFSSLSFFSNSFSTLVPPRPFVFLLSLSLSLSLLSFSNGVPFQIEIEIQFENFIDFKRKIDDIFPLLFPFM